MAPAVGAKLSADVEVGIDLLGARRQPEFRMEDKLPGRSNYLFGSDPSKWFTDVPQYSKVRYADVYPGIDVTYYGSQGSLEHDFEVHPGADVNRIRLAFSGAQYAELSSGGDLALRVGDGEVRLEKPRAYQVIRKKKVDVLANYVLRHGQAVFRLGRYDKSRILIIDPVLVYSTYFGGPGFIGRTQYAISCALIEVFVSCPLEGCDFVYPLHGTNCQIYNPTMPPGRPFACPERVRLFLDSTRRAC
jgi:hypothetical protein